MNKYNNTEIIESLAAEIGENIYIDVAKWHLYLSNAHLHTIIAEKVYSLLENNSVTENNVNQVLQEISVKLGGDKMEVSLKQLLPKECEKKLLEILKDFQHNL